MRIVVSGKSGQVTSALQALNGPDLEIVALGRPELDLASPETVLAAVSAAKPDVIVSAAAYTAVDKAESEPDEAFAVNRDGARALGAVAAKLGVPLIHLSTDYVFDGMKSTPYVESDETGPVSVYGKSKLEGERAVADGTADHVILRTAWVYSTFGQNFVKTMLRLAETRDELNVVADQYGCPTSAHDIADAVVAIAKRLVSDDDRDLRGVYHLSGSGETNWAGFSKHIFSILKEKTGKQVTVHDITTDQYPTPAKRPANSRLNCDRLEKNFGIRLPDWHESATAVVNELLKENGVR